ncbi:hypothetical protein FF36_01884 [Frankia torreyi]|uniref:Uncharacterized protein n=1 Tax=Frankia torreyi TaxID=1856 RepID=A0A0D8BI74_9ACTN|nr:MULTISPECIES: hypothetical protein [Frankia]KJE23699.1 hypothetical protein FF36_01884 [Frankia torreyi]KQM05689.1 hypothetical protein FF86_1014107 [Frankia sp. CpI1-P]
MTPAPPTPTPDLSSMSAAELAEYQRDAETSHAAAQALVERAAAGDADPDDVEALGLFARARARLRGSEAEAARREAVRRDRRDELVASIVDRPGDAARVVEHLEAIGQAVAGLRRIAEDRRTFISRTATGLRACGIPAGPRGAAGVWHADPVSGWAVGAGGRRVDQINPELLVALALRRAFGGAPSGWTLPLPSAASTDAADSDELTAVLRRELGEDA